MTSLHLEEIEQVWIGLKFIGPVLWSVLGILGTGLVGLFWIAVNHLKTIATDINSLTKTMVKHEERFESHETRIDKIEDKVFK